MFQVIDVSAVMQTAALVIETTAKCPTTAAQVREAREATLRLFDAAERIQNDDSDEAWRDLRDALAGCGRASR